MLINVGKSFVRIFQSGESRSSERPSKGFEGRQLAEPLILNMWDAIWTMIVTMTTVG
jgi:hypothetical protein